MSSLTLNSWILGHLLKCLVCLNLVLWLPRIEIKHKMWFSLVLILKLNVCFLLTHLMACSRALKHGWMLSGWKMVSLPISSSQNFVTQLYSQSVSASTRPQEMIWDFCSCNLLDYTFITHWLVISQSNDFMSWDLAVSQKYMKWIWPLNNTLYWHEIC